MYTISTIIIASLACVSAAGTGLQITFDEFDASNDNFAGLSNEYASLGVNFVTSDDGAIWDGTLGGDPGNWMITGTNGDQFMGFNGDAYGATMLFDDNLSFLQLDTSRSNGSQEGDSMMIEAYLDGMLVDSDMVVFGDSLDVWTTLTLSGDFDTVVISGQGTDFHPFGVDNIAWRLVPAPSSITMLAAAGLIGTRRRR